jgi:hypothetical protein
MDHAQSFVQCINFEENVPHVKKTSGLCYALEGWKILGISMSSK